MGTIKMSHYLKRVALLLILHTATCHPAKDADRPVHEVINEQARSDDIRPVLPYSNPLAGKSLQNVKQHAQTQQAMFNAERIRQHRAQTQRWNQVPTKADSYMRAYHDLQETHQLELEKEQSTVQEKKIMSPPPLKQEIPKQKSDNDAAKRIIDRGSKKHRNQRSQDLLEEEKLTSVTPPPVHQQNSKGKATRVPSTKQENLNQRQSFINTPIKKETLKDKQGPEIPKFTAEGAAVNRNHRSHGSLEYHKYVPRSHVTVQITPAPDYDQGVFIKSHGNVGFSNTYESEPKKLYTDTVSSKTQYLYPKQYGQQYSQYGNSNEYDQYLNSHNIDTLQTLLHKVPQEQANELNALVENHSSETQQAVDRPLDYHYVQNQQPYDNYQHAYADNALNYANINQNYQVQATSGEVRDHTPVSEVLNDVLSTQGQSVPFVHPTVATQAQYTNQPDITNYYNDQRQGYISSPTTEVTIEQHAVKYYGDVSTEHPHEQAEYYKQEYKPKIKHQPVVHYLNKNHYGKGSQDYYHHNNRAGVQHLSQKGDEVSAYGDDDAHYAANYEFGYGVNDDLANNNFGHYENKKDGKTDGHYHVLLPDGRMQNVHYTAGPGGFHADISYDHL